MEALLSFMGKDGLAYPSIPLIAQQAGVCETTVKRALREFRLRGWITWTNVRNGKRQGSNRYKVTISVNLINRVIAATRYAKEESKRIRQLFSRFNVPESPYYKIKAMTDSVISTVNAMGDSPDDPPSWSPHEMAFFNNEVAYTG